MLESFSHKKEPAHYMKINMLCINTEKSKPRVETRLEDTEKQVPRVETKTRESKKVQTEDMENVQGKGSKELFYKPNTL